MTSITDDEAITADLATREALERLSAPLHVLDLWSPLHASAYGSKLHTNPGCPTLRAPAQFGCYPAMKAVWAQVCTRCTPEARALSTVHDTEFAKLLRQHAEAILQAHAASPEERFGATLSACLERLPQACCELHEDAAREWRGWHHQQVARLRSSAVAEAGLSPNPRATHEQAALRDAMVRRVQRFGGLAGASAGWLRAYFEGGDAPARLAGAIRAVEERNPVELSLDALPETTEYTFPGGNLHAWLREIIASSRAGEVEEFLTSHEAALHEEEAKLGRCVLARFTGLRSFVGGPPEVLDPSILAHYHPVVVGEKVFAVLPVLVAEQLGYHCARSFSLARPVRLQGREEQLRLAAELEEGEMTLTQAWLAAGRALRAAA